MFAKVKPQVFLDTLTLELSSPDRKAIKAVLKDEKGAVCRHLESEASSHCSLIWSGLNDLPYGVYTIELKQGEDEMKLKIIKRV
ncbi:hypothetical protein ESA94_17885 [Lacibacter luteus]|uniref:T9SS type A sorting domain-containing protein n=1 Tax=Lacibacter luteus TaxID=2508719 RepID=A0A4Q1CF30_9BACT|nr:hypothetical protein [Lacibacter luteus]RXK58508.1 hypothetical protein ESA94_17885 [Lacibacter luteus]